MSKAKKDEEKKQVPKDVSESYVVSMGVPTETLNIPDIDGAFITAAHAGIHEDEIGAAAVPLSMKRASDGKEHEQIGGMTLTGNLAPAKGFVAKCIYQITDFSVRVEELNGQIRVRRWDSSKAGDNKANRELYVQLLQAPFRNTIEGFLDMMAGRDTEAQKDFEELKKEQPQLLSTS